MNQWSSVCGVYNDSTGAIGIYANGISFPLEKRGAAEILPPLAPVHINMIVLGAKYNKENSFDGKLTDFNIWSRALQKDEAIDWTNNTLLESSGDYYSWDKAELNMTDMKIINIPNAFGNSSDSLNSLSTYFDEQLMTRTNDKMTFDETTKLCKQIGGSIFKGRTEEDKINMAQAAKDYVGSYAAVWAGFIETSDERYSTGWNNSELPTEEWMEGKFYFKIFKVRI